MDLTNKHRSFALSGGGDGQHCSIFRLDPFMAKSIESFPIGAIELLCDTRGVMSNYHGRRLALVKVGN